MIEHIQRQINKNDIISYFPGMLYGYKTKYDDYNNLYKEFDSVKNDYNGNYNLIITDIEIPSNLISAITDYTDIYINIPTSYNGTITDIKYYGDYYLIDNLSQKNIYELTNNLNNGEKLTYYYIYNNDIYSYNNKITKGTLISDITLDNSTKHKYLTYKTLHKWYLFFKFYDKKRTSYNTKSIRYNTCMEMFNTEFDGIGDSSLYIKYDNLYIARGGDNMYKWLTDNIFVEYETIKSTNDNQYIQIDGENVPKYMPYPQIIQWKSWFKIYGNEGINNYGFYKKSCEESIEYKKTNYSISGYSDGEIGCFYREWTKKGGDDMYDWLMDKNFNDNTSFQMKSSSFYIPLLISNSINNLGEETILSEEWIPGHTYNKGDIFTFDEICYQSDNGNGYEYKDCTKEIIFNNNGLFNRNNINSAEQLANCEIFSYNEDNIFICNPTRFRMAKQCKIISGDFFYINNEYYDVITSDYIEVEDYLKNIRYFIVQYYGNKKSYCKIKKDIYEGDENYINLKIKKCQIKKYIIYHNGRFILYNGKYIKVNADNTLNLSINNETELTYTNFIGRFEYNNNIFRINRNYDVEYPNSLGNKIISQSDMEISNIPLYNDSYYIDFNNLIAYVIKKYMIYNIEISSGNTESKLNTFIRQDMLCDNAGNKINGYFNTTENNSYPTEGQILSIPIEKYYTSDLSKTDEIYTIKSSLDGVEYDKPLYYLFGDILTDISYYYLNSDNEETIIAESQIYNKDLWDEYEIYCRFTYVMGGIIKLIKENDSYHYQWIGNIDSESSNSNYHTGIIYTEERKLELDSEKYYLNNLDYEIIYYINIKDNYKTIFIGDNNEISSANVATFKYYKDYDSKNKTFLFDDSYITSPTFRQEYNLGISGLKNVTSDIYMDRGNAASFAMHLALGECKSFDALSKYQNGSIKIINNNDINTL